MVAYCRGLHVARYALCGKLRYWYASLAIQDGARLVAHVPDLCGGWALILEVQT